MVSACVMQGWNFCLFINTIIYIYIARTNAAILDRGGLDGDGGGTRVVVLMVAAGRVRWGGGRRVEGKGEEEE
jgi:hypothetical protein